MFSKIIKWIKEVFHKMIPYKSIGQAIEIEPSISNDMINAIDKWELMYKDESPWLNDGEGIYSYGIASSVCNVLANAVTLEMDMQINEPGTDKEVSDLSKKIDMNVRANYLNDVAHKELISKLPEKLEYGMATGGLVIKPYVSNGKIFFDFNTQGEFIPISFNDDGRITEIAFIDSFIQGKKRYTKVEYHKFDVATNEVLIRNTAYENFVNSTNNDLGTQISLENIPHWAGLEEETIIKNADRPLYGYYRVAQANNIDKTSPLGISVFSRATNMIRKADEQFSRLDWEYYGGELAIDIDFTAVKQDANKQIVLPKNSNRLFRKLDCGSEDTYKVFNPTLRDDNYKMGLNTYLKRIETICQLPKGSLCDDNSNMEYTNQLHLELSEQMAYRNINNNQKALQTALEDVVYVMNLYATLFNLTPDGDYETAFDWDDSIITDTNTELDQKLALNEAGVLSKAEVRSWYTGESETTAKSKIDEIQKEIEASQPKPLKDLFSNDTLES